MLRIALNKVYSNSSMQVRLSMGNFNTSTDVFRYVNNIPQNENSVGDVQSDL